MAKKSAIYRKWVLIGQYGRKRNRGDRNRPWAFLTTALPETTPLIISRW
jgi:hypothetical protein